MYDLNTMVLEKMFKGFKPQRVRQLFATSMGVAIYDKSKGRILDLLLDLFYKRRL